MIKATISIACCLVFQSLLLALPINQPIVASTFLAYPLETITIQAYQTAEERPEWSIPHGHILSVPGTGNISWASTIREGVYPIILKQSSKAEETAYIMVHNSSSTVSREEFAYLLALFLPPVNIDKESNIPDLPDNHWAGPALKTCKAYEILKLYPDGLLRPY
ncbi:hypothetical protein ACFL57_05680, partial [Candidatus Margulisiibacteriota bacterium]